MSNGFRILGPQSQLLFDSGVVAFVVIDSIYVPYGSNGSKSYESIPGLTLEAGSFLITDTVGDTAQNPGQLTLTTSVSGFQVSWSWNTATNIDGATIWVAGA